METPPVYYDRSHIEFLQKLWALHKKIKDKIVTKIGAHPLATG